MTPAQSVALDLYVEHLEEAAFLYEQRRHGLLDDPDLAWMDLADTEDRLEAHLDALVLGGDLALALCRERVEEGDAGELYAALCVCCRQQRKDLLVAALDSVEADDEERVLAVRDALASDLPDAWADTLTDWLSHGDVWRQRVVAYVIGSRRIAVAPRLVAALPEAAPDAVPDLLRALGRVGTDAERSAIWSYVRHEHAAVREAATLALLRLGGQAAVKHAAVHIPAPWAMLLLGVSGGAEHRAAIHAHAAAEGATPDGLLALGLLGDPQSVALFLDSLQDPALAEAAALALHLLTGADLDEDVFVPEEIDEDELFDDELEAFRRGEVPTRPDGEPFGTTRTRLSQDREAWGAWWEGQKGRFQSGLRYRLGEPCTPTSVVRALESKRMPRKMRQLLSEELIIRYSAGAYFEADAAVAAQGRGLGEAKRQVAQHDPPFQPGRWYLAGRLLTG
ncbi:MAG: hypothetical protein ABJF88_16100 [Rhodothermales bacterium]